jgi:hypothetical protein
MVKILFSRRLWRLPLPLPAVDFAPYSCGFRAWHAFCQSFEDGKEQSGTLSDDQQPRYDQQVFDTV